MWKSNYETVQANNNKVKSLMKQSASYRRDLKPLNSIKLGSTGASNGNHLDGLIDKKIDMMRNDISMNGNRLFARQHNNYLNKGEKQVVVGVNERCTGMERAGSGKKGSKIV